MAFDLVCTVRPEQVLIYLFVCQVAQNSFR
jgi:hypothetical protein